MTCDKCDKPAVIHEVTIKNGAKEEIHLCSEHAADAGFVIHQQAAPINQVLKQFVISHGGGSLGKAKRKTVPCPTCGLTFAGFRKSGMLGCPDCYEALVDDLGPLIERAQNGATHHIGKAPQRAQSQVNQRMEVRRLVRELDDAIASEKYERAAELRDRLNMIEPADVADSNGDDTSEGEGA